MLLSRLHALQIAHHPELAFPHDRLLDPTKKDFCLAFPYCTLESRRRIRGNHIRARRRRQTASVTSGGCGMSSRGNGSWLALRSERRARGSVPGGKQRGKDGSAAVGKPDKTTLCNVFCGHFCAPGKVACNPRSRLQIALLRLNWRSIAKLLPKAVFACQTKWCISKDLPRAARTAP